MRPVESRDGIEEAERCGQYVLSVSTEKRQDRIHRRAAELQVGAQRTLFAECVDVGGFV